MRRLTVLMVALCAMPFAAPTVSQGCAPGDAYTYFTGAAPATTVFPERSDGLIASDDQSYVGVGTWKIRILRGTVTSYINSPANGAPQSGLNAIRAGDHVTIYSYGPFSGILLFNDACATP